MPPRKPIEVMEVAKNHKKSKKWVEFRRKAEDSMILGTPELKAPDTILSDPVAWEKWQELESLFYGYKFISSADINILEQYCLTYSEYQFLQESRILMIKQMTENGEDRIKIVESLNKSKIDSMINSKCDLLLKLGRDTFLSPVARIKSAPLPKEDKKPESKLTKMGFGGI
jgi:phage terminase small subunit